jgi:hypothetical protein
MIPINLKLDASVSSLPGFSLGTLIGRAWDSPYDIDTGQLLQTEIQQIELL